MICIMTSNKTSRSKPRPVSLTNFTLKTVKKLEGPPSASQWLQRDSQFSLLTQQVDQLLIIQQLLVRQLGLKQIRVVRYDQETLTVIVPGAAAAAKLRQSEPELITHLHHAGWQCSRIKARPQTQFDKIDQPAVVFRQPISEATVRRLNATAKALEDGPIKEALIAMVTNSGRR
jgi:hypothetical protein